MKSDLIDVTMQLHHRTDLAVLASDDGDKENAVWLPLSQVEVLTKENGIIEVTMPGWLAVEKGLV